LDHLCEQDTEDTSRMQCVIDAFHTTGACRWRNCLYIFYSLSVRWNKWGGRTQ